MRGKATWGVRSQDASGRRDRASVDFVPPRWRKAGVCDEETKSNEERCVASTPMLSFPHDQAGAAIIRTGLPIDLERIEVRRYEAVPDEVDEGAASFERPVIERLVSRPYRDVAFRRKVREAYDYRCAMSGLRLRNGGGRPEVNAAHIRPVERQGSDFVRNGLALSGTLHWMFDRGLISVADDREHTILVSRNKVPREVADRLIVPSGQLVLPEDQRNWPHPDNLRWHRENVFGQVSLEGPSPWE